MVDDTSSAPSARIPTRADLARIARALNDHAVVYAVIGGFAMLHHGFARATMDIDLLVDPSPENVERLRRALCVLEDKAALEVRLGDVLTYTVVRVADEVVVDLLGRASETTLADVEDQIEVEEVDGVPVRYLSATAMLRTKQSVRPKDLTDRAFLEDLIRHRRG